MLCRRPKLVTPSHGSAWYNDIPMERGLDMVRLVGSKDAGGNYGFAKKKSEFEGPRTGAVSAELYFRQRQGTDRVVIEERAGAR